MLLLDVRDGEWECKVEFLRNALHNFLKEKHFATYFDDKETNNIYKLYLERICEEYILYNGKGVKTRR